MADYAAVFDGTTGKGTFADVTYSNNTDIKVKLKFVANQTGGIISNGGIGLYFRFAANSLRLRSSGTTYSSWAFTPTLNQDYVLDIECRSGSVELFIDTVSQGVMSGTFGTWLVNTIAMYNTTSFSNITVERVTITDNTTPANSRDFFNDVSAGSNVTWKDQSANATDATLVDTATDGSQWELIGGGGVTVTAESGTYLYAGTDANLLVSRIMQASSGSYTYTGTSINLLKGYVLTAQSGSYSYLGQDVTLTYTPVGANILIADSGSYVLTGTNINFNRDRVMIASSSSYLYQGTDIQITLPGQIWTDKPSVATNWNNQTNATTIWTDK